MFKKDLNASPIKRQKLKSSIQRSIRQSLLDTYPLLTPVIDDVLPKKSSLEQAKLPDRVSLYVVDGQPVLYQQDNDGPLLPHLRLVHRFPQCFPTVRIDRGAIRFVLSGATLMAPGLTSKGGRLPIPVERGPRQQQEGSVPPPGGEFAKGADPVVAAAGAEEAEDREDGHDLADLLSEGPDEDGHWSRELGKGEPVVVLAEGKEFAAAVGVLAMGTAEIKQKGKGPAIEEAHFLGDGLWRLTLD